MRARMSKSALMRCDDPVVSVTFENLSERALDGRVIVSPGIDPVWRTQGQAASVV